MNEKYINKTIERRINIFLSILFLIEFVFIFLYEFILTDIYYSDVTYKLGKIHVQFAYGYSMAYLFYLGTIVVPKMIRMRKMKPMRDVQIKRIKDSLATIFRFFICDDFDNSWMNKSLSELRVLIQSRQSNIDISKEYLIKQDKNSEFMMVHVSILENFSS